MSCLVIRLTLDDSLPKHFLASRKLESACVTPVSIGQVNSPSMKKVPHISQSDHLGILIRDADVDAIEKGIFKALRVASNALRLDW